MHNLEAKVLQAAAPESPSLLELTDWGDEDAIINVRQYLGGLKGSGQGTSTEMELVNDAAHNHAENCGREALTLEHTIKNLYGTPIAKANRQREGRGTGSP